MPADHYIATDAYHLMLDRIIAAPINPGLCLRSTLIEILSEAGISPASVIEEQIAERQRKRSRGEK